ncbi:MAG: carboxy terminal-processing peptidase, partial [Verrucomicrobiales bacterium]
DKADNKTGDKKKEVLTAEQQNRKIRDDLKKRWDRVLKGLEDNDEEEVVNYFLSALSMAYDPHSDYFSHRELENFQISMRHSLTGIGAMLGMADGMAEIQGLVIGGPADKSKKLHVNDRIIAVAQGIEGEMVDIVDMRLPKIVEFIRGKKGSIVRLSVIPAGGDVSEAGEIAIVRDTVELKDKLANAELIITEDTDGQQERIGWIYLYSFYADMNGGSTSTTTDVRRLLDRLIKENIDGLVLDLRSNGGGSLEEAINLTGLFIPRGPVVQSKDWRAHADFRRSRNKYPLYDGPLVVLTDKASASASEILAAALQDYNRAIIIGEKSTFGKGTVQTIMPVSRQMPIFSDKERAGALKVTIQKFYRIAGGSTQLKGVEPDLVIPSRSDFLDFGEESLDNPLGYDTIDPQQFIAVNEDPFPIAELKHRMLPRITGNQDFQYVLEDGARLKDRLDKNVMSINKQARIEENETNRLRNEARTAERRKRYAAVEKAEKDLFEVYKLTLDNVDETTLTLRDDFSDEESSGMIMASHDDKDGGEKALVFPHKFDPVKRETLEILSDYVAIERKEAGHTVKISETAGSPGTAVRVP